LIPSSAPNRNLNINQTIKKQAGVRHNIFVVSADMIQQKPIIGYGYGYGGFERSFLDHFNQYSLKKPTIGTTPQNFSHPIMRCYFGSLRAALLPSWRLYYLQWDFYSPGEELHF